MLEFHQIDDRGIVWLNVFDISEIQPSYANAVIITMRRGVRYTVHGNIADIITEIERKKKL